MHCEGIKNNLSLGEKKTSLWECHSARKGVNVRFLSDTSISAAMKTEAGEQKKIQVKETNVEKAEREQ